MTEWQNESSSEGVPSEDHAFSPNWPRVAGVTAVTGLLFALVIAALATISFGLISGGSYGPGKVELFSARRVEVWGILVRAKIVLL